MLPSLVNPMQALVTARVRPQRVVSLDRPDCGRTEFGIPPQNPFVAFQLET